MDGRAQGGRVRTLGAGARGFAWAFLALATAVFIVRGPARAPQSSGDLAPPYAGARAWLEGTDPYADSSLSRVLVDGGRETNERGQPYFNPSLYPPPSFLVLAPFGALSWPAARITFLVLCVVLFLLQLRSLLSLAQLSYKETLGLWLLGGATALAPIHTGIALGQVAIPSAMLLVMAIDQLERDQETRGGVLLALATLFKPQLAGPFILYYALRRHGRAAAIAVGICGFATLVTVGWLWANDVAWIASWKHATASVLTPGSEHDPAGPLSAQLLELRPMIAAFTDFGSPGLVGFVMTLVLGTVVYVLGRALPKQYDTLLLSLVAVLTLFATYHRFYDAAVLTIVLVWAASTFARQRELERQALVATVCCAVFFAPGAWMMQRLANDGTIPPSVAQSTYWNVILIRHQNWSLVVLFVALFLAMTTARRRASQNVVEVAGLDVSASA